MTGFSIRLQRATAFEDAIVEKLRALHYFADKFGQGQLPTHQRNLLRLHDTPARWLPDIICQRQFGDCSLCLFIDAKSGETYKETGRHDIETASLNALVGWKQFSKLPVFVITADWYVHDPDLIQSVARPGYSRGIGSGTPFVLWPANSGQAWDAFFDVDLLSLLAR